METAAGHESTDEFAEFSLTQLLSAAQKGDAHAYASVYDRAYQELHGLASWYMQSVPASDTLQPTALVNEAYLRICERTDLSPSNTREFFGIVSRAMRDILVEQARRHGSQKRGAGWTRLTIEMDSLETKSASVDVSPVQLSDAIEQLSKVEPDIEELIRLRFFAGLSLQAVSQLLEVPVSRVRQDWDYARAWLRSNLTAQLSELESDE